MIHIKKMIDKKQKHYIGVSGGVDSIAIAHFLLMRDFNVTLFHYNHKATDQDSLMEAAVSKFAETLSVPLVIERRGEEFKEGYSFEMACRELRFKAFSQLDANIILAHHLDDCIEAHFIHFLTGKENFYPMPVCTEINDNVSIYRPFLLNPKENFRKYVRRFNLQEFVVEDKTNYDTELGERSWLRNKVIPMINERRPIKKIVLRKVKESYDNFFAQKNILGQNRMLKGNRQCL